MSDSRCEHCQRLVTQLERDGHISDSLHAHPTAEIAACPCWCHDTWRHLNGTK